MLYIWLVKIVGVTWVTIWCRTYTGSDVHSKRTSDTMISQFWQTIQVTFADAYIAFDKLTLHPKWYVLSRFKLMGILKNVCLRCRTYITKVVEHGKTVMKKQKDWEFSLISNWKVYPLTILEVYRCCIVLSSSGDNSKIHFD